MTFLLAQCFATYWLKWMLKLNHYFFANITELDLTFQYCENCGYWYFGIIHLMNLVDWYYISGTSRYSTLNILQYLIYRQLKWAPIACLQGQGIGCFGGVQRLIIGLAFFFSYCVQYHVLFNYIILRVQRSNQSSSYHITGFRSTSAVKQT